MSIKDEPAPLTSWVVDCGKEPGARLPDEESAARLSSVRCGHHPQFPTSPGAAVEDTGSSMATAPLDSSSLRGVFGWKTIPGATSIPYLLRGNQKLISVRIVEVALLAKYPSTYPDELRKNSQPESLPSRFATAAEAKLLNEINTIHCDNEYGAEQFTTSDQLVTLEDFEKFYAIVRQHYGDVPVNSQRTEARAPQTSAALPQQDTRSAEVPTCCWMQVNNTVVPCVQRVATKLLPLSVLRYSAGLLNDAPVLGQEVTAEECNGLNEMCRNSGITFAFPRSAKFISLSLLRILINSELILMDLPKENPFEHTVYNPELEPGASKSSPQKSLDGPRATALDSNHQTRPRCPLPQNSTHQVSIGLQSSQPPQQMLCQQETGMPRLQQAQPGPFRSAFGDQQSPVSPSCLGSHDSQPVRYPTCWPEAKWPPQAAVVTLGQRLPYSTHQGPAPAPHPPPHYSISHAHGTHQVAMPGQWSATFPHHHSLLRPAAESLSFDQQHVSPNARFGHFSSLQSRNSAGVGNYGATHQVEPASCVPAVSGMPAAFPGQPHLAYFQERDNCQRHSIQAGKTHPVRRASYPASVPLPTQTPATACFPPGSTVPPYQLSPGWNIPQGQPQITWPACNPTPPNPGPAFLPRHQSSTPGSASCNSHGRGRTSATSPGVPSLSPASKVTVSARKPALLERAPRRRKKKSPSKWENDLLGEDISREQYPGMTPPVFPGMLTSEPSPELHRVEPPAPLSERMIAEAAGKEDADPESVKVTLMVNRFTCPGGDSLALPSLPLTSAGRHNRSPSPPSLSSHSSMPAETLTSISALHQAPATNPLHDLSNLTPAQRRCISSFKLLSVAGQEISCLVRHNDEAYTLLEALSHIFFPGKEEKDVSLALNFLAPESQCFLSRDEEVACIHYYKLPVLKLMSRRIINVVIFERQLSRMKEMLGAEESTTANSNLDTAASSTRPSIVNSDVASALLAKLATCKPSGSTSDTTPQKEVPPASLSANGTQLQAKITQLTSGSTAGSGRLSDTDDCPNDSQKRCHDADVDVTGEELCVVGPEFNVWAKRRMASAPSTSNPLLVNLLESGDEATDGNNNSTGPDTALALN